MTEDGMVGWHHRLNGQHVCSVASVVFDSLQPHGLQPIRPPSSVGFSKQEYWSGLPCPPPGALPDPEIEHGSPAMQTDSLPLSHRVSPKHRINKEFTRESHSLQPARPLCSWNSPGKNTGISSYSLLQGLFLAQGSNRVSCIAGRFFAL